MVRYINYATTRVCVLSSFSLCARVSKRRDLNLPYVYLTQFFTLSYKRLRDVTRAYIRRCAQKSRQKLDAHTHTRAKWFSNTFRLTYGRICNGKNRGELVECRLCLEDTNMPCQLVSRIVLLIIEQLIIFSCSIGVDDTFCCSKVEEKGIASATQEY